MSFEAVQGFDQIAYSHWDVVQVIAFGQADAGVSNAAIAVAFDLDFIPLHQSRYDLVVLKDYLELAPVERLFSTLNNRWVHAQLKGLASMKPALPKATTTAIMPRGARLVVGDGDPVGQLLCGVFKSF